MKPFVLTNLSRHPFLSWALCLLCIATTFCSHAGAATTANGPINVLLPHPAQPIQALPLQIKADLGTYRPGAPLRVLLNGTDISSAFTIVGHVATATVADEHRISVGDNRLVFQLCHDQQRNQSENEAFSEPATTTVAHFTFDPDSKTFAGAQAPRPTVPIQTQVATQDQSGNPSSGIQVGATLYNNPGDGFRWQLLLLSRKDLSLLANRSYNLNTSYEAGTLDNFILDITPGGRLLGQCPQGGCLMVLQAPYHTIFAYPCNGPGADSTRCQSFRSALAAIGATSLITLPTFLNGDSTALFSSFIGNVGSHVLHDGDNFESVACITSSGCLNLPVPDPTETNEDFVAGLAPNGVDGVMPNLAHTGNQGTKNIPAHDSMPAVTVYDTHAAISGNLVLDINGNYTFTYAAPPIRFQMGPDPSNPGKHIVILQSPRKSSFRFPNNSRTLAGESALLPSGAAGGFHLVVWDATNFRNLANSTYVINPKYCNGNCISPDGTPIYSLDQLAVTLKNLPSRNAIWFLGSVGNLRHDYSETLPSGAVINGQDAWDRVAQAVQDLGGTFSTFASLDNQALADNPYDQKNPNHVPTDDDYNMVGQLWINGTGVANPYAAEASRAISRQTSATPVAGNLQGILEVGHDGFYAVKLSTQRAGLVTVPALDFVTASRQSRTAWPLTGTNDAPGLGNAYAYISKQLQQCSSAAHCSDIRRSYTNLNQDFALLYSALSGEQPPTDCDNPGNPCGFSDAQFGTAKDQLLTEFHYVDLLHKFNSNLNTALAFRTSTFSLLFSQVQDAVLAGISYPGTVQIGANTTDDLLNLAGDIGGFAGLIPGYGSGISAAISTAVGYSEFLLDSGGQTANSADGVGLATQVKDLATLSEIAGHRVAQFNRSLRGLGLTFNRIESDWGRLQIAGQQLVDNQVIFDDETNARIASTYELSVRRSLYSQLMPLNYQSVHYRYAEPGLNFTAHKMQPGWAASGGWCYAWEGMPNVQADNPDSYGFWPGALIDGPGASVQTSASTNGNLYPFDVWWDLWFILKSGFPYGCPMDNPSQLLPPATFFTTAELFTPIGKDNSANGFYRPWFFSRGPLPRSRITGPSTFYWYYWHAYGQGLIHSPDRNWQVDPDNY